MRRPPAVASPQAPLSRQGSQAVLCCAALCRKVKLELPVDQVVPYLQAKNGKAQG